MNSEKEIKALLKSARESIKAKEYKNALQDARSILSKDKKNYMALVFCGLCLAELNEFDKAAAAYSRATDISPEQAVAWEGLAKLPDKTSDPKIDELALAAIQKLTELVSPDEQSGDKLFNYSNKLVELNLKAENMQGVVSALEAQQSAFKNNDDKYRKALEGTVSVLSKQPGLSPEQSDFLFRSVEQLLHDKPTMENQENCKLFLKLAYRLGKISLLLSKAPAVIEIFPDSLFPVEWICKVYMEWTTGLVNESSDIFQEPIIYYEQLLAARSSMGKAAKAAHLWHQKNAGDALQLAMEALEEISSPNFHYLNLAVLIQLDLKKFELAEIYLPKALKYAKQVKDAGQRAMAVKRLVTKACDMFMQNPSEDYLSLSWSLLSDVDDLSGDGELSVYKAKILAWQGKKDELASLLDSQSFDVDVVTLVRSICLVTTKAFAEAEELLKKYLSAHPDSVDGLLLMGQLYWEKGDFADSVPLFLKSAKLDPLRWLPFLFLGNYYYKCGGDTALGKASKCFQKCLQLNPMQMEAGMTLSDIYRKEGKDTENLQLLLEVTDKYTASSGKASWAWLRLGITYLNANQASSAIQCLQSVLRVEGENYICWEALADAYLARGSLVAAQKAYEKSLTLNPTSLYSKLKVANIKHKLGMWQSAINDYLMLLEENKDDVPGLIGLAVSLYAQGQYYLDQYIDKNVLDCVEKSLEILVRAAKLRPDMLCVWRLIGDCCGLVLDLSVKAVSVPVPSILIHPDSDSDAVHLASKMELLQLGTNCYARALRYSETDWSLWHQLGLFYFGMYKEDPQRGRSSGLYAKSIDMLKHCISLADNKRLAWTTLGIVSAVGGDLALAQHAFISSLRIENSSEAWTGLGVVYLVASEARLANLAFKEAQNQDPNYLKGWAGQAFVAEIAGYKSETMDLFRHCTFLGPEAESALGYSNSVCATLKDMEHDKDSVIAHNRYIIDEMYGVAVGLDSAIKCSSRYPDSFEAFSQLSVLAERNGLIRTALKAAEAAIDLANKGGLAEGDEFLDKMYTNYGRLLWKLKRYEDSVAAYSKVKTSCVSSEIGLALSYFALSKYPESYQAYERCLHWLADNDELKSHVLVAMGVLAYKVEGIDSAKTLLFQSAQLKSSSIAGLLALSVIGIQNSDLALIEAAESEMHPHRFNLRYGHDIAFIKAAVLLLKGDSNGARRCLLKSLHCQPWLSDLWRMTAIFLLQNYPNMQAARCAVAASRRADHMDRSLVGQQQGKEVAEQSLRADSFLPALLIETVAQLVAGNREEARRCALRLMHTYPHLATSWCAVGSALNTDVAFRKNLLNLVTSCGGGGSTGLATWAKQMAVI